MKKILILVLIAMAMLFTSCDIMNYFIDDDEKVNDTDPVWPASM